MSHSKHLPLYGIVTRTCGGSSICVITDTIKMWSARRWTSDMENKFNKCRHCQVQAIEWKRWESCWSIKIWMSYTILTSRRRWALWNNLLRINVYLGLWVLGRNDPKLGADRPRSWGGSTAFGADRPGADRLGTLNTTSAKILHRRRWLPLLLKLNCFFFEIWSDFNKLKKTPDLAAT